MNKKIIWAIIVLIIIGGIYYAMTYRAAYPTPSAETSTPSAQQPATTGPVLKIGIDATLGNYLAATNGFTLYTFTKDTEGISNCVDACAANWPPYIVPAAGAASADPAITGKLGTIQRADGTIQLTYKGMPLYFWIKDAKIGDTTGQGVNNVWYVAKP